jgi:outer membrane receptor protein involved in Fe transport
MKKILLSLSLVIVSLFAVSQVDVRSSLKGSVTDGSGPVSGAEVVVVFTPTGSTDRAVTNAAGAFVVNNLAPGGPYTVTVTKAGYAEAKAMDVFTKFSETSNVNVFMAAEFEEVVVSAQALESTIRFGNGTVFGEDVIDGLPSTDRGIQDIASLDPRVSVGQSEDFFSLSIGGSNPRTNDITIDGVSVNDAFGLNDSGQPTLRNSFSIETVKQLSVDVVPFDASRGGFTTGSVNAVTKSGTNEFEGDFYVFNRDQGMVGTDAFGNDPDVFNEDTFGFSAGGPIVKDKLFFYFNFESFEQTYPSFYGPVGSGATDEAYYVTQALVDRVRASASSLYGLDIGNYDSEQNNQSENTFLKLNYLINDNHEAEMSYIDTTSNLVKVRGNPPFGFALDSQWYDDRQGLEVVTTKLFSDWNDKLSTQVTYSTRSQTDNQDPVRGDDFPSVSIVINNGDGSCTGSSNCTNPFRTIWGSSRSGQYETLRFGQDQFRYMNEIIVDSSQFTFKGFYAASADHDISFGYESSEEDIMNSFRVCGGGCYGFSGIDAFEAGTPIYYKLEGAVGGGVGADAVNWTLEKSSMYLQDEWRVNDKLNVMLGYRVDWTETNTAPNANADYLAATGYRTDVLIDDEVTAGRFGFDYDATDGFFDYFLGGRTYDWLPVEALTIRGGYGKFVGRLPNVWISNSFSNDGGLNKVNFETFTFDGTPIDGVIFDPNANDQSRTERLTSSTGGDVNSLDPNFGLPISNRGALAFDFDLSDGMFFGVEYNRDSVERAFAYIDPNLEGNVAGTLPDGRTYYNNSEGDLHTTFTDLGSTESWSYKFTKSWFDNKLKMYLAYSDTEAEDVFAAGSSTQGSNYGKYATCNNQFSPNLCTKPSLWGASERYVGTLDYTAEFFGADNPTRFYLYWLRESGRPFSYTYDSNIIGDGYRDERDLWYVPTGPNDPLVSFSDGTGDAFYAFVDRYLSDYKGQVAPANAFQSPWKTRMDLKITQEIALPDTPYVGDAKAELFLDIYNFGNLLDDENGQIYDAGYLGVTKSLDVTVNADNTYTYSNFDDGHLRYRNGSRFVSVWKAMVGFKLSF